MNPDYDRVRALIGGNRPAEKTPGQIAYEQDCERRPTYPDGRPRPAWDTLAETSRWTWERNPTPREYRT